jgi:hypothetical protein
MAEILPSTEGMNTSKLLSRIVFAGILASACASGPRARPETAKRVPDSAPEKIAAQRAATGLHQEEEDQRWGFDAARERRRQSEEKKAQAVKQPPPPPPTEGPVDLVQPADPGAR